jgi:hypothetical protein
VTSLGYVQAKTLLKYKEDIISTIYFLFIFLIYSPHPKISGVCVSLRDSIGLAVTCECTWFTWFELVGCQL